MSFFHHITYNLYFPFHKAINELSSCLKKFPLVKNGISYPFGLTSITSFIFTNVKKRFIKSSSYNYKVEMFDSMETYVRDIFADQQTKQYSNYDQTAIKKIISEYYSGKKERVDELDWLYTFEMFRRKLNIT